MMTISPVEKSEFLRSLAARRLPGVSLPIAQAIVERISAALGVAFADYGKYAADVGRGKRTAERTVPALCRHGLVKVYARRNGPPALWVPSLLDMAPAEAIRRVEWAVRNRGKDHREYFGAGSAKNGGPYELGSAKSGGSGSARNGGHKPISNNSSLREEAPRPRGGVEAKRGTRLPEYWRPSPADRAFGKQKGLSDAEIETTADDFWRYWTSEAGSRSIKLNWSRTWERWVIKDIGSRKPAHRTSTGQRVAEPAPDPRTFTHEDWRNIRDVMLKNPGSKWPKDHWGPPPGRPDCLMPEPLQLELGLSGGSVKAGAA
jgi:hypothetical protein